MKSLLIYKWKGSTNVLPYDSEKWIPYKNTYLVARTGGVIRNYKTGEKLQQTYNTKGYLRVWIGNKQMLVHRVVMAAYNGESELDVDHGDGQRDNNDLSNLEYVTPKENQRRARERKAWGVKSNLDYSDVPF